MCTLRMHARTLCIVALASIGTVTAQTAAGVWLDWAGAPLTSLVNSDVLSADESETPVEAAGSADVADATEESGSLEGVEAPRAGETPAKKLVRVYRVTAYCDRGLTASGVPSGVGQCAAPADIPFGSKIYIPALKRTFVVTDRTHKRFRHNTVDLFIPQREACLEFGRNYLECEISLPDQPPRYASPRLVKLVENHARQHTPLD